MGESTPYLGKEHQIEVAETESGEIEFRHRLIVPAAHLTQIPKLGCKIEGFMRRFHLANRTSEKLV